MQPECVKGNPVEAAGNAGGNAGVERYELSNGVVQKAVICFEGDKIGERESSDGGIFSARHIT